MEFFNSKKFIVLILTVLFLSTFSGCAKKSLEVQGPTQGNTIDSVGKMKSIGTIIGCMFAPTDPECEKLRNKPKVSPHQTQKEYNEEITKEFDQIEKGIK
jgi:hypothetical protein